MCVFSSALIRPHTGAPLSHTPVTERRCYEWIKVLQQFQTFNMNWKPMNQRGNPPFPNISSLASISAIHHLILHFILLHFKQEASLICKTKEGGLNKKTIYKSAPERSSDWARSEWERRATARRRDVRALLLVKWTPGYQRSAKSLCTVQACAFKHCLSNEADSTRLVPPNGPNIRKGSVAISLWGGTEVASVSGEVEFTSWWDTYSPCSLEMNEHLRMTDFSIVLWINNPINRSHRSSQIPEDSIRVINGL